MTLHLPGPRVTFDHKHLCQTVQKIAGVVTTVVFASVNGCSRELPEPPPIEQDRGLEPLFSMDVVTDRRVPGRTNGCASWAWPPRVVRSRPTGR